MNAVAYKCTVYDVIQDMPIQALRKEINMSGNMNSIDRRDFLRKSVLTGMASYGALSEFGTQDLFAEGDGLPDMVAVKNGELDVMFD